MLMQFSHTKQALNFQLDMLLTRRSWPALPDLGTCIDGFVWSTGKVLSYLKETREVGNLKNNKNTGMHSNLA